MRPKGLNKAEVYAWDIRAGKILACEWVKLAVKRYFDDLEREKSGKFGFYFDRAAAEVQQDYFAFLRHSKAEWAGQVFVLEGWQAFVNWNVFGWKENATGFRRFKTMYLEVARKNGKTTFLAGDGLFLFDGDGEPGAEVYAAATKLDQAKIVHSEATRMIKSSPTLRKRIGIHVNNLHNSETNSLFEPLGRDHSTMDGLNISGAIVDELHAHKTRDVVDVIETATGSRRQPLICYITTAGFNRQSVCFEFHERTQKILERSLIDETWFGMIYTLDKEDFEDNSDGWKNQNVWIKANPNLGVSVKLADMQRKAKKAAEMPTELNSFLRLKLNIWTESETRWLPPESWAACGFPVEPDGLRGRELYGGLDLSSNKDLTAFALVCPPAADDDRFQVLMRFWIPQDRLIERVRRDRVPYDVWVRSGFIKTTPGNAVDYKFILAEISELAQQFDIMEIAFDRWGASKVIQDLRDMGFEKPTDNKHAARHLIDFGQGFASMSAPTKELENLVLKKQLAHGNNPVLGWNASNVVVLHDPAGNIKPDKGKSIEKIDGIVALIMALDRALLHGSKRSVYEDRGVIAL